MGKSISFYVKPRYSFFKRHKCGNHVQMSEQSPFFQNLTRKLREKNTTFEILQNQKYSHTAIPTPQYVDTKTLLEKRQHLHNDLDGAQGKMVQAKSSGSFSKNKEEHPLSRNNQPIYDIPQNGIYALKTPEHHIEMHYAHGQKNGLFNTYDTKGKKQTSAHYREGLLHGPFETYNTQGGILTRTNYVHGKETGERLTYDEFGDIIERASYQDGQRQGATTRYFPKVLGHQVSEHYIYEKDQLVGEQKKFHPNGMIKEQHVHLENGQPAQYPIFFDDSGRTVKTA